MSSKSTTDQKPSESFAEWKERVLGKDARKETFGPLTGTGNQYHVQAKLPPALFREFWALIKAKNFTKSTGVQYAIYKLIQDETNV